MSHLGVVKIRSSADHEVIEGGKDRGGERNGVTVIYGVMPPFSLMSSRFANGTEVTTHRVNICNGSATSAQWPLNVIYLIIYSYTYIFFICKSSAKTFQVTSRVNIVLTIYRVTSSNLTAAELQSRQH